MTDQHHVQAYASSSKSRRGFWSLGALFDIKASGVDTRNLFALSEAIMTKLAEPPLHVHHAEDEAWYVLQGKLTFHVGDVVLDATPGTFVFAPKDIPHWFSVDVEPSRVLVITSPGGGFEKIVEEGGLAEEESAGPVPPDPQKLMGLAGKYQFEILGPPPTASAQHS